jgi:hypothetical protein
MVLVYFADLMYTNIFLSFRISRLISRSASTQKVVSESATKKHRVQKTKKAEVTAPGVEEPKKRRPRTKKLDTDSTSDTPKKTAVLC